MNIMLFSKICARSGVGNHMRELAECLVEKGHQVWIVSSTNDQGVENKERLKIVLMPVATKNPLQMLKNFFRLHDLIVTNQIEIVHCHHRMAALYMRAYRLLWKIPVVYTLHSAPIPSDFLHRKLTYVGDHAIAVSTELKEFMINKLKVPNEKIDVIFNGVYPPDLKCGGR